MRFGLGKRASKTIAEDEKASFVMVSSNKILTVSYGTFSCTLEGFDQSFDTMKAIAEYFRDLAQDDRYFGAEPPTPDAEMLARIAEREIERRVEARFVKGNWVLRPTEQSESPQGDVAPDRSSDAANVGATAGVAATALAVATAKAKEDAEPDETGPAQDDANRPQNDPEVAGTPEPRTEAETVSGLDDLPDEETTVDLSELELDTDADDIAVDADDVLSEDDAFSTEQSIDDLISEQADKADRAAKELADDARAESTQEVTAPPTPPTVAVTDSVADKLQRIRAVVAAKSQAPQVQASDHAEPEYIEDEHAMSGPDGDGIDENDAIDPDGAIQASSMAEAEEDKDESDSAPAAQDEDTLFADTIAGMMSDQIEDVDSVPESGRQERMKETASDASPHGTPESELQALRARIAELEAQTAAAEPRVTDKDADAIAGLYADEHEADPAEETDDTAALALDDLEDLEDIDDNDTGSDAPRALEKARQDDQAEPEDAPSTDNKAAPLVARVGKAKRADVESALAAGDIEEFNEDAVIDTAAAGDTDSALTKEEEEELARELAELHAEIETDDDWNFDAEDDTEDDAANANIRKAVKMTSPARAMLTDTAIAEDDTSVDRLVDKTETEMDEPEGNRRRSAIAHLRAAVAATKAERLLGKSKPKADEEEPYREDLADAVRPRRPKVTQARSERPAPVRTAPLKLVAEQRIDTDEDAQGDPVKPVRPRRIQRNMDAAAPAGASTAVEDTGFADFAEQQGANTLSELLEAAAAYMSFVEGHDQFSRPQLMTILHQAESDASSREERLRSFGQLLREGKIEKKGGGRFAASDNIGFKPDARAAG